MFPTIGKIYRHFKGNTYKVFLFSVAKKDYQEGDIYQSSQGISIVAASSISKGQDVVIYYKNVGSGREYWARSLNNFMETLTIPRFSEVQE